MARLRLGVGPYLEEMLARFSVRCEQLQHQFTCLRRDGHLPGSGNYRAGLGGVDHDCGGRDRYSDAFGECPGRIAIQSDGDGLGIVDEFDAKRNGAYIELGATGELLQVKRAPITIIGMHASTELTGDCARRYRITNDYGLISRLG